MRLALGLEYDGSRFAGWQTQPHGNTIQDVLEKALCEIAGVPVATVCAGRTDAGVHALAQVVHIDVPVRRSDSAWVRGVNTYLPDRLAVLWAQPVTEEFHARFSARSRRYRYVLLNHPVRPALQADRVGWYHGSLDEIAMQQGADFLLGEQDFSSFQAAGCQAKSPIRQLLRAEVRRSGACLVFDFEANAFLYHMVRNLVGALLQVGKKKRPPEWIGELLAQRDRRRGAPTVAASGLYLSGVVYDPAWQLPGNPRMITPFLPDAAAFGGAAAESAGDAEP